MTVRSQLSELGRRGFCLPPPYKIGSQNTPFKLGLTVFANALCREYLFWSKFNFFDQE